MRRCVADFGFCSLAAELSGNPGIAARFALADGENGARPRRPVARPVPGVSIMPDDATSQTARKLKIKVADGGAPIDGVVALSGLPNGLQSLNAECGQK